MGRVETKFKQTEVGLIPVDWEVKDLGLVGEIKMGQSPLSQFYNNKESGLPLIQGNADIENRTTIIRNYTSSITKVAKKGDVIMTVRAPVGEVSKAIFECCIGRGVCAIKFVTNYPYHFLIFIENSWSKFSTGSTFDSINSYQLKAVKIGLPTDTTEQTLIANTLSDVDLYIESLEKLIAKKQKIKQGSLQQLLKPKENWEVKRLGDLCTITTGKLDANAMVENGQYRFYTCAKDFYFIDKYAFETEALLVSGNGANVGYIHYYKGRFNAYQRTYVVDEFNEDILFVKYHLEFNLHKRISIEKKEGNTPYIVMSTLTEMLISLPNKDEQTKIAQTLSDIDSEITALTQKLNKAKALKQGMMQQLLTGKIRLV